MPVVVRFSLCGRYVADGFEGAMVVEPGDPFQRGQLPVGVAMFVAEVPRDLSRRSSSAWAKNALATFKISLARRNSLFSRSSSLTRCASVDVTPSRTPVSTSWRLIHSSSVCGTQPILGAIDSTADHNDGYSPRCSCTMRTACSRTSGENLFDLFMAQSFQRAEPPQKTGRLMDEASMLGVAAPWILKTARICRWSCRFSPTPRARSIPYVVVFTCSRLDWQRCRAR